MSFRIKSQEVEKLRRQKIRRTMQRKFRTGELKQWNTGKPLEEWHKNKVSDSLKGKMPKNLKIFQKASLAKRDKFNGICIRNSLPYSFVGNGKFFIERKCPDFINCNGEKIAIEVFYKRHKQFTTGGFEEWKNNRNQIFLKY